MPHHPRARRLAATPAVRSRSDADARDGWDLLDDEVTRELTTADPSPELSIEVVADLDACGGFSTGVLPPGVGMWDVERGPAYDALYGHPSLDELRLASSETWLDADDERWTDAVMVEAVERGPDDARR